MVVLLLSIIIIIITITITSTTIRTLNALILIRIGNFFHICTRAEFGVSCRYREGRIKSCEERSKKLLVDVGQDATRLMPSLT